MAKQNIEETISRYEHFINNVLKDDLRQLEMRLEQVNGEIADLLQQKQTLKIVTDMEVDSGGFKTQVDLGSNFFMQATVPDTSKMLFNIGLNTYVEFTTAEANKYINLRIEAFERQGTGLRNKAAETKAHIKLMLFGIAELQNKKKNPKPPR